VRARQRNTRVRSEPNQQPCPVTARTKRPRHAQNGELGASRLQPGYNPADKHGGALYDLTLCVPVPLLPEGLHARAGQ